MSSLYVRNNIEQFLTDNSAEQYIIDLSGEFQDINVLLESYNVPRQSGWLGLTYIADDEVPQTIPSSNTKGKFREIGVVTLHVIDRTYLKVRDRILTRAESLRTLLRGQNINDIRVFNVTPPNFEQGATIDFEGGFTSASMNVGYEYDVNL